MTNYPTYKLGEVADYINGRAFKPSEWKENGLPIVRIQNLNDESAVYHYSDAEHEEKYLLHDGDLLFAWAASLGTYIWNGGEAWLNQHIFKVLPKQNVSKMYLYYALTSIIKELYSKSHGSGMVHVTKGKFEETEIPLPPLPTQRAIVTRIESLFAELDKAVQHLRTAQQQLKTYRQAVLRDAFEGNLTKEWRKHNHISNETWEEKSFSSIAEIKSNLVDVSDYKDYPHIAPDNIEKETGKLLEYHTIAEDGVISGKHRFFTGQILYSKIRPNLSKVVIVSFDGLCSADMYPIEAKGNTKFLWYQMLSDRFVDYASNSGSRTVLPKINQKGLSIIPMKICSIEEQNEVVIQIESRLSQATASETYIENALQQAEALRQSILKKAFSGELV